MGLLSHSDGTSVSCLWDGRPIGMGRPSQKKGNGLGKLSATKKSREPL